MTLLRRAALALLLVAGAASTASAQIPSFGITGGLNFGALTDAATANLDNSTGYHVGVFAQMGLGPVAVRPALLYLHAGDIEIRDSPVTTRRMSASFVSIPVDLMFSTGTPLVRPYFLLGPEFRFPVAARAEGVDRRDVNVAINAGIGAELGGLLLPGFSAELRYAYDVSGVARGVMLPLGGGQVDDTYRLNLFMLRLGFSL